MSSITYDHLEQLEYLRQGYHAGCTVLQEDCSGFFDTGSGLYPCSFD